MKPNLEKPGIILLGLGPGKAELITREAWEILENSTEVWLRTMRHPAVDGMPATLHVHSFDSYYEAGEDFKSVYTSIVAKVLELGRRAEGVVYAVPGHPFLAEATGPEIFRLAQLEGLPVRVVEGLSFLEPVMTALELDPLPQTVLVDALVLATQHVPSFPPTSPALISQIYSRSIASEVKLTLNSVYPDGHPVKLVHAAGTTKQQIESIPLFQIDRSRKIGLQTVLYVPPLGSDTSFESFQEVIAHLRAPDGCPWDREQTHLSLRRYLLEEAYEAIQALDAEDFPSMQEEFGDLLLQVVLHAQIASETGDFNINDVLQSVNRKIVRRHPHVFGDIELGDSDSVLKNWERLKAQERQQNGQPEKGLLDSVADALPALVQAEQYLSRAARVGFDWPEIQDVLAKIEEEILEVRQASDAERQSEIGDLMFALVNFARWYHIDAESALRDTNRRFKNRFRYLESASREKEKPLSEFTLDELLALWQESKRQ